MVAAVQGPDHLPGLRVEAEDVAVVLVHPDHVERANEPLGVAGLLIGIGDLQLRWSRGPQLVRGLVVAAPGQGDDQQNCPHDPVHAQDHDGVQGVTSPGQHIGCPRGGTEWRTVRDLRQRLPRRGHRVRRRAAAAGARGAGAGRRVRRGADGVGLPRPAADAVAEPDPGREVRRRRAAAPAAADRAGPAQRVARPGPLGHVEPRRAHRPVRGAAVPADGPERLSVDARPAGGLRPQRGRADGDPVRHQPRRRARAVRPGRAPVPHRRRRTLRRLGAHAARCHPVPVRPGAEAADGSGAGRRHRLRLPRGPAGRAAPSSTTPSPTWPATTPGTSRSSCGTPRPATPWRSGPMPRTRG